MTETHDALEVLQSEPAAALLARSPSRPRHELRTKQLHDSLPWQDQQPGYESQLSVAKFSSSALSRSLWSTKPTRAVGVPGVRRIAARPVGFSNQ